MRATCSALDHGWPGRTSRVSASHAYCEGRLHVGGWRGRRHPHLRVTPGAGFCTPVKAGMVCGHRTWLLFRLPAAGVGPSLAQRGCGRWLQSLTEGRGVRLLDVEGAPAARLHAQEREEEEGRAGAVPRARAGGCPHPTGLAEPAHPSCLARNHPKATKRRNK